MSDHEEAFDTPRDDTRYSTPVPEFDDHRHQSASVPRGDRSRRGTVDTLYGSTARNMMTSDSSWPSEGFLHPSSRDFEHAVIDGESGTVSPAPDRSQRSRTASVERDGSPPNSMKAFAEGRRREREVLASDHNAIKHYDGGSIHRTLSANSRHSWRSLRSRRYTNENDTVSLETSTPSVEEDVCFPQQVSDVKRDKRKLYIDFDYLERFIAEDERDRTPLKNQPLPRIFHDLRNQQRNTNLGSGACKEPSGDSSSDEKVEDPILDERFELQQHADLNRFSFFSSAWESTIHAAEFKDLIMPGESIRGLFTFPENEQDGVWWLNMVNLTEEEIRPVCRAFGIHPLTIEDIQTQETREKVELFPSYYFACFRSFNSVEIDGQKELEPYNVYVIVFREGVLTFSFAPNSHASYVRKRIASLQDYLVLNSDWICYALIDHIVDSFAPEITKIEKETDNIEDEVFITRSEDMQGFLRRIGEVRKNVMGLMKLLGGKADVLKGFAKRCNEHYGVAPPVDIGLYLGDVQDHAVTMMSNLAHFEKMLSRSHSNYLAQLSIDNITQGNRANKVLGKVTLLASILVPLNLICGLFGMNVAVPFREVTNLIPFFVILSSLLIFTVISLAWARRMRYI